MKRLTHWRWHRLLGIVGAIPLLMCALSGIILAFKERLEPMLPTQMADPWPIVYQVHRGLLAGTIGKAVVSLAGLSLWILWWTGRRLDSGKGRRHRRRSWHVRLGDSLGPILAVLCTLGSLLNFREPLSDLFDPIASRNPASQPVQVAMSATALQLAQREAHALHPEGGPAQLRLPDAQRPYLLLFYRDETRIYADPVTGAVVKVRSRWSHWTSALHPLHTLQPLGRSAPWLSAALAGCLTFLCCRGLAHFRYTRRRTPRQFESRP